MTTETLLGFLATTFGVFMGVAPVLQARLIVRRKSSEGVALSTVLIMAAGMALWLSYGLASGSVPLVVANSVSTTAWLVLSLVIVAYRPLRLGRKSKENH